MRSFDLIDNDSRWWPQWTLVAGMPALGGPHAYEFDLGQPPPGMAELRIVTGISPPYPESFAPRTRVRVVIRDQRGQTVVDMDGVLGRDWQPRQEPMDFGYVPVPERVFTVKPGQILRATIEVDPPAGETEERIMITLRAGGGHAPAI
ncbi:MAG TPA: hypothetical protein VD963_05815 [Phycisphaerales bacterium]|nr:hypothetical protein [Phycisphaerales bacterium]